MTSPVTAPEAFYVSSPSQFLPDSVDFTKLTLSTRITQLVSELLTPKEKMAEQITVLKPKNITQMICTPTIIREDMICEVRELPIPWFSRLMYRIMMVVAFTIGLPFTLAFLGASALMNRESYLRNIQNFQDIMKGSWMVATKASSLYRETCLIRSYMSKEYKTDNTYLHKSEKPIVLNVKERALYHVVYEVAHDNQFEVEKSADSIPSSSKVTSEIAKRYRFSMRGRRASYGTPKLNPLLNTYFDLATFVSERMNCTTEEFKTVLMKLTSLIESRKDLTSEDNFNTFIDLLYYSSKEGKKEAVIEHLIKNSEAFDKFIKFFAATKVSHSMKDIMAIEYTSNGTKVSFADQLMKVLQGKEADTSLYDNPDNSSSS